MENTGFMPDKTMGISQDVLAVLIVPLPNRKGLSCRCLITFPPICSGSLLVSILSSRQWHASVQGVPSSLRSLLCASNLLGEERW